MIATILSATLVLAVGAAYAHGHASGVRQVWAEAEALAEAKRRGSRDSRIS